ncbi:MAG: LVIVD repeat-containing protein [Gemmatimonadota bacterium]
MRESEGIRPRRAAGRAVALACVLAILPRGATAQDSPYGANLGHPGDDLPPGRRGTPNIEVVSHLPLGGFLHVADIEIEQELARPYVYVSKRFDPTGVDILDLSNPRRPRVLLRWRIEDSALHQGSGALDGKAFRVGDRYYYVQSFQFASGGPDRDLGAIVFDVTGLPDASKVREVGRIREPDTPGGFHNIFVYRHSDGRTLLFTTVGASHANVYDLGRFVRSESEALAATIPLPDVGEGPGRYHDFFVGYEPESGQDRFYGGGTGGYFVYDVTDLEAPEMLASITGVSGVRWGHTITPTPDGRYVVTEAEYQYAPLRIFDLAPALAGDVPTITQPVGAWTADWRNLSHNHEVRWPYVFVSAYEDGLQVFSLFDPTNPTTVGYYDTYEGPHMARGEGNVNMGAWGVDVRNADGLIVVSDMATGFWAFRMEGFQGWNGNAWGMPNISSEQDWVRGPVEQAGAIE